MWNWWNYFKKDKPILYNELKIISEANKNRGPDSYGEWINNNKTISIINRRLSTQDARSIANQPIFSSNGRSVTVLNGEIYNHFDLRNFLKKKDIALKVTVMLKLLLPLMITGAKSLLKNLRVNTHFLH